MSRYQNSNIISNSRKVEQDGTIRFIRRLETTIYPDPSHNSQNNRYVLSREGDRLDNLSFEFYGTDAHWYLIARANHLGKGSLFVPPGVVLIIPSVETGMEVINAIKAYNETR